MAIKCSCKCFNSYKAFVSLSPTSCFRLLANHIHVESSIVPADEDFEALEGQSIANRCYWTRRIHLLCAADGNVDEALRLLGNLRLRGYRPDSLNLASIIHALCDVRHYDDAHRRIALAAATGWLPDDRTANVLVARLLDAHAPRRTLDVVRRLCEAKPAFVPSLTNYNRLIDQLCAHSQLVDARGLLSEMRGKGRLPDAVSYTALINGFNRVGEIDIAHQLFDEMIKGGILPNSLTYSVLIKGVLRKRKVDEAKDLMQGLWLKMEEEGNLSVNVAAFANLIDSLCREGFFHEVFRIAEEMPQGKTVKDEFVYSQMIDSLCRAGMHHGASRIVYIMRKRGCTPSLVSYNCIIHGLGKDGGGMRAYQLFKEGAKFGYVPSECTYKVLVESLCQERDLDKAKDVTEFMLSRDEVDRTRIYNILMSALRVLENPSEQLNLLVSMLQKQCRPDVVTLNTVIHGFCKIGKIDEARNIMDDMLSGKFCAPDVVTFTTVITGLLDEGKVEAALHLVHMVMPQCRCAPNIVTYNVVIGGLVKLQKVNEALGIFQDMLCKGITANCTTYTQLIDGLCLTGRLEEAKKFWDDIIWPSKEHDDYVYAAILRGLCHNGKFGQACDFLYELVDCAVGPGIINYNILIGCASKLGLKKEAYQIMNEMKKNGLKPDAVTWRILDKLHGKESKEFISPQPISKLETCAEGIATPDSEGLLNISQDKELDVRIAEYEEPKNEYDGMTPTVPDNEGLLYISQDKEHDVKIAEYEEPKTEYDGMKPPVPESEGLLYISQDKKLDVRIAEYEEPKNEYDGMIEENGDPLQGLVDPNHSNELSEENRIANDSRDKQKTHMTGDTVEILQPEPREPLSSIARRVFGLP